MPYRDGKGNGGMYEALGKHCTNPRKVARTYVQGFLFARTFNSDLCMAAPYVQVCTTGRLRCPPGV